jgi:hypothetical protein
MKLRSTKTAAVAVAALAAITAATLVPTPAANAADPTGTVTAYAPEGASVLKGDVLVWQNQLLATRNAGGFTAFDLNGTASASPIAAGVVKAYTTFGSLLAWVEGVSLKTSNAGGTVTGLLGAPIPAASDSILAVGAELWIGRPGAIDRYTPTATAYPAAVALPGPFTGTVRMTIGPDNNIWVIDSTGAVDTLSRWTPAGVAVGAPLNFPNTSADPSAIAVGGDGAVWVIESGINSIARITTSLAISEYPLPVGSVPKSLIAGPGGMWLAENGTNQVSLLTVPGGVFTRTPFTAPPSSGLQSMTVGPDGNVWAVGTLANKIAKFGTTAPTTTTTAAPTTTTILSTTTVAPTTVAPTTVAPTTAAPTTAAPTTAAPPPATIVIVKTRVCTKFRRVRIKVGKKVTIKSTCIRYRVR